MTAFLEFVAIMMNSWSSIDNHKQINRLQGKDIWGNPLAETGSPLNQQVNQKVRSPGQPPPIRAVVVQRPAFGPTWGELGSASARVVRRVMRVAVLFVMVLIAIVVFAMVLGLSISR